MSKFISLVLRHKPEIIGLTLDTNGWADSSELVEKINAHGFQLTTGILNHIVATNAKKRFSFNETKTRIRANQGHSINVELNLERTTPPSCLYHGTGKKSVPSILAAGLEKRDRQYVHLSVDLETAKMVGQRHGESKVFIVASGQMNLEGFSFYLSVNGVWLIDYVPAKYLTLYDK